MFNSMAKADCWKQECLPVVQEAIQNYPVGYVSALENHAAMLERTLNERYQGMAVDYLGSVRPQYEPRPAPILDLSHLSRLDFPTGTSPEAERIWQWPAPQTPIAVSGMMEAPLHQDTRANSHSSPSEANRQSRGLSLSLPNQGVASRPDGMDEIPTATGASFFRTYFQAIHPQYPFLSVKECGEWYNEWKLTSSNGPISGWPAFFVKMVRSSSSMLALFCDLTCQDLCNRLLDTIKVR
jgi:hypothetical protein